MELFSRYSPLAILLLFVTKMLFISASPAEMGIVFALAAIVGLEKYMERNSHIQEMKISIEKQNEVLKKMAIEIDGMRTNVSAMKLHQGMKRTS